MSSNTTKRRLGRGLDGLLPAAPPPSVAPKPNAEVDIDEVHPNRDQPRRHFDDDALNELAASIKEHGILEPIVVRDRAQGGFEIIAGERRWRASQRAGLKRVPIYVRDLSEQAAFEAALVENIQREDLNAVETARAFQRLADEFGLTQDAIAERVGKNRSTVTNSLRLLKLPDSILAHIESGQLSEGHGRALLTAPDSATMTKLSRAVIEHGLSVRETERRARAANSPKAKDEPAKKNANLVDLERRLSHSMGTTVAVDEKKGRGQITLQFASLDELDRLIERLL